MGLFDPGTKTKHIKELCEAMGPEYSIKDIDGEWCIYRDLQEGHDIEISGMNTASLKKKANIYLWGGSNEAPHTFSILFKVFEVPQENIKAVADSMAKRIAAGDWKPFNNSFEAWAESFL